MRLRCRGFTLIELMIVVAIIAIIAAVAIPSLLRSKMSSNHSNAGAALKSIVTQEGIWRTQDIDKNGVADFWVKDVAAFYGVCDAGGRCVALIDHAFAQADHQGAAAVAGGGGAFAFAYKIGSGGGAVLTSLPKQGYYFRAVVNDQGGAPYADPVLANPCLAVPLNGSAGNTNAGRFGFCAIPSFYNSAGVLTFLAGEDGVIWQKEVAPAGGSSFVSPVTSRQSAAPPGTDTSWSQFGS